MLEAVFSLTHNMGPTTKEYFRLRRLLHKHYCLIWLLLCEDIAREKAEFEAFCQAEAWVSMVVAFNIVALGSTGKQKKAHTHANGNEFS